MTYITGGKAPLTQKFKLYTLSIYNFFTRIQQHQQQPSLIPLNMVGYMDTTL